jgi:branched-chain amino acid transport system substrate-binding protein
MSHKRKVIGLTCLLGLLGATTACGSSAKSAHSKVVVGELMPFTGKISSIVKGVVTGADVAVKVINANGGVLGHPLEVVPSDTAGDVADAVTAFRSLELQSPAFVIGPTSLEASAVNALFDPAHLPDFTADGSPQLDTMTYRYVFRSQTSDSVEGTAMAYYAIHQGLKRAAFMITNDAAGQPLIPALTRTYQSHGGVLVYQNTLTADQPSYSSEIERIFAAKPDAIFLHSDEPTAATLFRNMESLGKLNIPVIADSIGVDPSVAKAMGLGLASQYLTGLATSNPGGTADATYTRLYQQYEGAAPPEQSNLFYDAVNIFALAMDAAKSTDPKVFVNFVTQVTNPPGVKCYDYVSCASLLKSGQKINFEGASNPFDYNQYHNIFGDFSIVGWGSNGVGHEAFHINETDLASF